MRKFWGLSLFGLFIFCANNAFAAGVKDAGLSYSTCSQVIDNPESMIGWFEETVSLLKLYEYSPYKEKKKAMLPVQPVNTCTIKQPVLLRPHQDDA